MLACMDIETSLIAFLLQDVVKDSPASKKNVLFNSKNQFLKLQGFERVYKEIPDIHLDVPQAYTVMEQFVEQCHQMGIIVKELRDLCPSR